MVSMRNEAEMSHHLEYLRLKCPDHIEQLVHMGAFDAARAAIKRHLSYKCPPLLRQRLEHELLNMTLLERDFIYTKASLFDALSPLISNLEVHEIDVLEEEGDLLWHMVNGEKKYHKRAVKTVIKEKCTLEERKKIALYAPAEFYLNEYKAIDEAIEKMKTQGEMTVEISLEARLNLKKHVVKDRDENVRRFYLPLARKSHFTKRVALLEVSDANAKISDEKSSQRVAYLESDPKTDTFKIKYQFLNHMVYRPLYEVAEALEKKSGFLNTEKDTESSLEDILEPKNLYEKLDEGSKEVYLAEKSPHILFTPLLVNLVHEIIGDETEPLLKAKRIYDFVTQNIHYRFMGSYRMLTNIPEYGALNFRGDCGVQALLMITLLRIAGIPAAFSSGLMATHGGGTGMHDWCAFYVAPYGWCFSDPSYGESAFRRGNFDKWHFYFGNLDPFRMMSNFDFQEPFEFEKSFPRDDPYDNQVGEAETNLRGLYSDDYDNDVNLVMIREVYNESF